MMCRFNNDIFDIINLYYSQINEIIIILQSHLLSIYRYISMFVRWEDSPLRSWRFRFETAVTTTEQRTEGTINDWKMSQSDPDLEQDKRITNYAKFKTIKILNNNWNEIKIKGWLPQFLDRSTEDLTPFSKLGLNFYLNYMNAKEWTVGNLVIKFVIKKWCTHTYFFQQHKRWWNFGLKFWTRNYYSRPFKHVIIIFLS